MYTTIITYKIHKCPYHYQGTLVPKGVYPCGMCDEFEDPDFEAGSNRLYDFTLTHKETTCPKEHIEALKNDIAPLNTCVKYHIEKVDQVTEEKVNEEKMYKMP